MNVSVITGTLQDDIVTKVTPQNVVVANFKILSKRVRSKDEKIDAIPCVAYGDIAEDMARKFKKGDEIVVNGELQFNVDVQKRKTYAKVIIDKYDIVKSKKIDEKSE